MTKILASAGVALCLLVPHRRAQAGRPIDVAQHETVSEEEWRALRSSFGATPPSRALYSRWLEVLDPLNLLPELRPRSGKVVLSEGWEGPPFKVTLDPTDPELPNTPGSLRGLKILLDPGHYGGAWSQLELREVRIPGVAAAVHEGNLTWGSALVAKEALEKRGAVVTLSRNAPPETPFPNLRDIKRHMKASCASLIEFFAQSTASRRLPRWLKENPGEAKDFCRAMQSEAQNRRKAFKVYNRYDFRRRSLIGSPDEMLLSMHYNLASDVSKNHIVVFMHGGLLPEEKESVADRYYLLRRTLSDPRPLINLGTSMGHALQRAFSLGARDIAAVQNPNPRSFVVDETSGLYGRNLGVLKRSPGWALLLEGPCMNNRDEHARLRAKDFQLEGRWYPNRIRAYATAIVEGLEAAYGCAVASPEQNICSE